MWAVTVGVVLVLVLVVGLLWLFGLRE